MEMDYATEFSMDHRPRKRAKLAWELPQTHSKAHSGMYFGQDFANVTTSYGTLRVLPDQGGLSIKGVQEKGSPQWREDDKDGHYVFALGENLTSRCKCI